MRKLLVWSWISAGIMVATSTHGYLKRCEPNVQHRITIAIVAGMAWPGIMIVRYLTNEPMACKERT